MNNDSNKPKLRFNKFIDVWEQRKLGDISAKVTRKNQNIVVDEVFTNSAEYGIISQRDYFDKDIANSENIDCYYIVEPDDFVYNPRISTLAPFGPIRRNKLNKSGAMSPLYYVFRVHNVDLGYLEYYFKTDGWYNFMHLNGNSGARSDRFAIRDDIFKEMPISMPQDIDEQHKIGTYFETLDNLITLCQRESEKLQIMKKTLLQKMFPKNGESAPEVRFKEFTDNWEQRKVGDVMIESRELGHKGDKANKMTVKLWGKGVYEKNEAGSSNTQYFIRHKGQFIYSKLDFLNSAFGVVPEELENYETTADVPAFDCNDINPYFMFYTATQPNFYLTNGMIADGSRKAKRIHVETFLDMPLYIPNVDEQNKIVDYFANLDNLITLHQRKLEKLKNIKKSMLQKMFV